MRDFAILYLLCCGLLAGSLNGAAKEAQKTPSPARQLSDQEVAEAIRCGRDGNCFDGVRLANAFWGGATVRIEGPFGRVAAFAREAKRKYLESSVADVPAALRGPILVLTAEPEKPRRITDTVAKYDHIVVRAKTPKGSQAATAVQPTQTVTIPLEWENVFGGKLIGEALVAHFSIETFPDAPEIEITAIRRGGGEEKFTIKQADLIRRKVLLR